MKSLSGYGSSDYIVGQRPPIGIPEMGESQRPSYTESRSFSNAAQSPAELPASDMAYLVELPTSNYSRDLPPQSPLSARSPPGVATPEPGTAYRPYEPPSSPEEPRTTWHPIEIERPGRPDPLDHLSYDLPLSAQPSPPLEAPVRADTFNYNQLKAAVENDARRPSLKSPIIRINEPDSDNEPDPKSRLGGRDSSPTAVALDELISRLSIHQQIHTNDDFLRKRKVARELFRRNMKMVAVDDLYGIPRFNMVGRDGRIGSERDEGYRARVEDEEEEDIYGA